MSKPRAIKITRSTVMFGPRFDELARCEGAELKGDALYILDNSECYQRIASEVKPQPTKARKTLRKGPGTELEKMFDEAGTESDSSCGCDALRDQMDEWGPAQCRLNIGAIVEHLRVAYRGLDLDEKVAAMKYFGKRGLLSVRAIVEEAIRRSEGADARSSRL